jgi:hypothetical protein|tara:strand:+ start:149 stop:838 length:690 start_codon:yes stop_codon:yes gene_type:complete
MVLPSSGAISLGQMATEYSDSQPNSINEFYRGGDNVPTTVSGTATQAAPSSNGTYSDFGGVTGLTLVRSTSSSQVGPTTTSTFSPGASVSVGNSSSSNHVSVDLYNKSDGDSGSNIYVTITGSSSSRNFTMQNSGTAQPIGSGPYTILNASGGKNLQYRYYYTQSSLAYTFTNNTGFDVTIEGTTVANGASSAISPSGDYNISFTINANPNVPTSGTIDFADFYGGRAS